MGIAHEIRNPLTTLKGFVEMIEYDTSFIKKYASIMKSQIERIQLITNEMLLLGKPINKKKERKKIANIVEDVITLLMPESNLKNIQLNFDNKLREDMELFNKH